MSVGAFLGELRRRDVRVWVDGDRLRCDAPSGVLTPELRDQLRLRKEEVMEFLRAAQRLADQQRAIVPLRPGGTRTPIFGVAGHNGDVFCYRALAHHLGGDQPFYGLEPPGFDGESEPLTRIEDLAGYFAEQIRAFQPQGPYVLAGYCAGGATAFELARQLQQGGATVRYVGLFGSPHPGWYRYPAQFAQAAASQLRRVGTHVRELAARPAGARMRYLREKWLQARMRAHPASAPADPVLALRRRRIEAATLAALRRYRPGRLAGRLGLFLPSRDWHLVWGAARRWHALCDQCEEHWGPAGCDGFNMLLEPAAPVFAELLRGRLSCNEPEAADPLSASSDAPSGWTRRVTPIIDGL